MIRRRPFRRLSPASPFPQVQLPGGQGHCNRNIAGEGKEGRQNIQLGGSKAGISVQKDPAALQKPGRRSLLAQKLGQHLRGDKTVFLITEKGLLKRKNLPQFPCQGRTAS